MKKMLVIFSGLAIVLLVGFNPGDKEEPSALKTFSEAEVKIILDNAVHIEPIDKLVIRKIPVGKAADAQFVTISTQSFMVYVDVDDKGVLVRNPKRKGKSALIDPKPPKPIVVTPNCVGYCSPSCTKSGCAPEDGHCSAIDCAGAGCNNICSNYAIATGAASIVIR